MANVSDKRGVQAQGLTRIGVVPNYYSAPHPMSENPNTAGKMIPVSVEPLVGVLALRLRRISDSFRLGQHETRCKDYNLQLDMATEPPYAQCYGRHRSSNPGMKPGSPICCMYGGGPRVKTYSEGLAGTVSIVGVAT